MDWKKIFVINSSLLYLILIGLFFYYYRFKFICGYTKPCLHFCSTDFEEYSDKYLLEGFKNDNISEWYRIEDDIKVKIYRGLPVCDGELIDLEETTKDDDKSINFYNEPSVYLNGKLGLQNYDSLHPNQYCLQYDGKQIDALICLSENMVSQPLVIIMTVFSLIIMISTLSVYAYFPELRDFHEKMIIYFIGSLICSYMLIPGFHEKIDFTKRLLSFLLGLGFSSGHLWLNSMILSIYFTFRDYKTSNSKERDFSSYAVYSLVFTSIAGLFVIWETMDNENTGIRFITLVHYYMLLNDLVFLIITYVFIRRASKQIEYSERTEFENEKKWYWIFMKLFAIIAVTWSIQLFALKNEVDYFGNLTTNFIMLFTAVNVCSLFLGRKKVRDLLSKKYHGESNAQTDVNI